MTRVIHSFSTLTRISSHRTRLDSALSPKLARSSPSSCLPALIHATSPIFVCKDVHCLSQHGEALPALLVTHLSHAITLATHPRTALLVVRRCSMTTSVRLCHTAGCFGLDISADGDNDDYDAGGAFDGDVPWEQNVNA